MTFYGQNGQRNDVLYFVMTSSSWTLIVMAYQMTPSLDKAQHTAQGTKQTWWAVLSQRSIFCLSGACKALLAFQRGMLFPCHAVLQQTGTLRLLSFPKQHEVQMDFTAAESFSGSRLLFFIGKW